MKHERKSLAVK